MSRFFSIGHEFKTLILSILVIGVSFYLGISIYPLNPGLKNNELATISVKEFGFLLNESAEKDLTLWTKQSPFVVSSTDAQKWLENYTRNYSGKEDVRISQERIINFLSTLALKFDTEPVNAKLNFKNNRAEIFVPPVNGRKLNINLSAGLIATAMLDGKSSVSLVFEEIEPEITLEKINDLGINTLLAKGESDYGKSSLSRINNIKMGMTKFNGLILEPGEIFSFNKILGEVDGDSGFQAELVIKSGQLVKEYGGGLCQVSTTVFRAAIMAGLPIVERKPHSFPVQYYNPQGFDSTIYPGVVDLKFTNDTKNHVLIQTKVTGSRLSVEIYGYADGRTVAIEGPVQYDNRPDGAMKAYFNRTITMADGTKKEERFNSVYKAPPPHPEERNPLE